ncbi:MAG: tetratricopeptide repeat protein [Clostridia bacterium]|nr:tetratricopeptide repeat protein [Deltaproteobacteria bacterium]
MKRVALLMLVTCARNPQQRTPAAALAQSVSHATLEKGLVFERQGNFDAALQQYRNAYEAEPEAPHTAAQLARVLARKGDTNAAISIVGAGQKRRPDDAELYALAASLARLRSDLPGARENAKAALARSPLDPAGTVELARALVNEKKLALAFAMVERALAAHPNDARLHVALADVARANDDDSRALAELIAAGECDAHDPSVQLRIGAVALDHRDYGRAKAAFEKAIALGDASGAGAAGMQVVQQSESVK